MKISLVLGVLATSSIILSGCQSNPLIDSNTASIQTLTLNKTINFGPNQVRAYFQNGEFIGNSGFNQFAQHCRIELSNLEEFKQTLQPQTFKVSRINTDEEMVAHKTPNTPVISESQVLMASLLANDGRYERPETMDLIHFYLSSKTQPNVYRLTCAGSLSDGNPMDEPHSHRPDKKVINQILGAYGSLN